MKPLSVDAALRAATVSAEEGRADLRVRLLEVVAAAKREAFEEAAAAVEDEPMATGDGFGTYPRSMVERTRWHVEDCAAAVRALAEKVGAP